MTKEIKERIRYIEEQQDLENEIELENYLYNMEHDDKETDLQSIEKENKNEKENLFI
ncbi:MAG: hypothetical protein ACOC80_10665 [Petrotogales bacterium]